MKNNYGANVGKTILKSANGSIKEIAKAYASAGSDARMSGCNMPVIINSGSGNHKSLQSCPTLCDPIDGSPLGSPIPGILQARTLEWVAISFSNA